MSAQSTKSKFLSLRTILSLSLLIIITGGFYACGGGGGDGTELPAPTAEVIPASPALINGSTSIVITFDTSMDSSSLSLGGSLASGSDGGIWSDTVETNDTLTINPVATWSDGVQTLTVDAESAAGKSLDTLSLSYTVDVNLSVTSISPPNDSIIANTVNIVVTYSETMDTSSLVTSGTMWSGSEGITWSTTNFPDDTLTISPDATVWWPIGANTLVLPANNQAGHNITVTLNYTVEVDSDHDGSPVSLDCNDGDDTIYPGAPEVCDGVDNDCDGQTDETDPLIGTACDGTDSDLCYEGTLACVSGSLACTDITGDGIELCDGVDNDCDGVTDEGFNTGQSCSAGIGICQRSGVFACSFNGTTTVCNAIPGLPSDEICNGLDDDCDGQTDESLAPPFPLCENQQGVCAGSVKDASLCQGGAWSACSSLDYTANNPSYESPEVTSDGLDNDCDGTTDEGSL